MASRRDEPEEDATITSEVTSLVSQSQLRDRLAERQQAILDQLHRRLQPIEPTSPELNIVWRQLRGDWTWVAIVPAEPDYSTAAFTRALCQAGRRLSVYPVEYEEATKLDLDGSTRLIARLGISAGAAGGWSAPNAQQFSSSYGAPITKTLVALESPLVNPLALPVALAADGVVLCVRRGHDRLESVRDSIQAVGADHILCCALID